MKTILKTLFAVTVCFTFLTTPLLAQETNPISKEIDSDFWLPQAKAISAHDFVSVGKFYHPDAILVSQGRDKTTPIDQTLARWAKDADALKAAGGEAGVSFRFTKRLDGETTAYQEGMFHFYSIDGKGKRTGGPYYFSALLKKKNGKWLMMMENQIRSATLAEWDALAKNGTVGTLKEAKR